MVEDMHFHSLIKSQIDALVSLGGSVAKDVGKIVVEAQDFSVAAIQSNAQLARDLAGVKSVSDLIRIQSEHASAAFETAVARSKKFGELFTELSRDTIKSVAVGVESARTPVKAPSVRPLQAAE